MIANTFSIRNISNLIFAGGGLKSVAYVGALKGLADNNFSLEKIKRVGGVSAGAITALLVALNYSIDEISEILQDNIFSKFLDGGFFDHILGVAKDFGYYEGNKLLTWIQEDLIEKKTGLKNPTFTELKDLGYKEMYLMATNLSRGVVEIFSYEHTPDMPVSIAVRASSSIPFMFRAMHFSIDAGKFNPNGNEVYIDGGVVNNYPIHLFDRMKYISEEQKPFAIKKIKTLLEENPNYLHVQAAAQYQNISDDNFPLVNHETLGFILEQQDKLVYYKDLNARPDPIIINSFNYAEYNKALYRVLLDSQQNEALMRNGIDLLRTIVLNVYNVSTTDFSIDSATIKKVIASGEECVNNYFRLMGRTDTA